MEAGFRCYYHITFIVVLTYTYKLPLHFVAKVKVIKEVEKCSKQIFHITHYLDAKVIQLLETAMFLAVFLFLRTYFFFRNVSRIGVKQSMSTPASKHLQPWSTSGAI